MSASDSRYIHGTAPDEQRRLARLNDLLNETSLKQLGLVGGESVLDVGCGLGQFSRVMARAVGPRGVVLGIERSPEQLAEAMRSAREAKEEDLFELRRGDALDLPLSPEEWGSFDLVYTRFLLEHLTDPLAAVQAMVRAARPGGRIVLEDEDHDILRLWPEPPGVEAMWRAYIRTYEAIGNDPYVGRRLVTLLSQAGAEPVRNTWLFFGSCSGEESFPDYVENMARIMEGAREAILKAGSLTAPRLDAAVESLREWGRRPDAGFWYGRSWAEGKRVE